MTLDNNNNKMIKWNGKLQTTLNIRKCSFWLWVISGLTINEYRAKLRYVGVLLALSNLLFLIFQSFETTSFKFFEQTSRFSLYFICEFCFRWQFRYTSHFPIHILWIRGFFCCTFTVWTVNYADMTFDHFLSRHWPHCECV